MNSVPFYEALEDCSRLAGKVPQALCLLVGEIPVIGQGKQAIEGFTNDSGLAFRGELPVILFGDHTAAFKFIDYPFTRGADGTKLFRPRSDQLDAKYAWHFLQTIQLPQTGYDRKAKYLENISIPLPPLEEQRRIAAILDKTGSLEACSRLREKSLSSFEDSLFFHFFGEIAEQEDRWGWHRFGDLCSRLTVGVVVKPASYYCENGTPALRSLNVKTGSISKEKLVFISDRDNNGALAKSKLAKDDLVFVRSGRPGTCAVIPSELDGCNAIDLLLATVDQSRILPEFAVSYFNSRGGRASILSESRGQVQQHFNAGSLAAAQIPVPPLSVQQEFCAVLDQRRMQSRRCEYSLAALGRLSSSLRSDLFGGA